MNRAELIERLDFERRTQVSVGTESTWLSDRTRVFSAVGGWAGIQWSSIEESNLDFAIQEEITHHRNLGVGFEWKVYRHDRPASLLDRLAAAGFEIGPEEAVMVVPVEHPIEPVLGVQVCWIKSEEHLRQYERIESTVFDHGPSGAVAELDAAIANQTDTTVEGILALIDGVAVGAARLYTSPDSWFAGLYGGGTIPSYRGRGVYREMVAARAQRAAELGSRYLLVDALATSRPILERLGFKHITDTWACPWNPK